MTDARTLKNKIYVFNEIYTRNQVYEGLEWPSGERMPREYVSVNVVPVITLNSDSLVFSPLLRRWIIEEVNAHIDEVCAALDKNPEDTGTLSTFMVSQSFRSWKICGENTPELTESLGYLNGKDLYPGFEFTKFEDYVKE